MRTRNLMGLAALLLMAGVGLGLASASYAGPVAMGLALLSYTAALGFAAMAGNAIGRFGLKYLLVAILGHGILAGGGLGLFGLLIPFGVFFWIKHEIGSAYWASVQGAPDAPDAPAP